MEITPFGRTPPPPSQLISPFGLFVTGKSALMRSRLTKSFNKASLAIQPDLKSHDKQREPPLGPSLNKSIRAEQAHENWSAKAHTCFSATFVIVEPQSTSAYLERKSQSPACGEATAFLASFGGSQLLLKPATFSGFPDEGWSQALSYS